MNRTYKFTVFPDSKNKKSNLQNVLDEISNLPAGSFARIKLPKGIYKGQFFFDGNKLYPGKMGVSIVIEGRGIGKTRISGSLAASEILSDGFKRGTFRTYTAFFSGPHVELKGLTIENTSGLPPPEGIGGKAMQGIALYAAAETMICKKVELLGHQDTLFLAPLPVAEREKGGFRGPGEFALRKPTLQLYEKCFVSGTVDFVFGGAAALFSKCKFVVRNEVCESSDTQKTEASNFSQGKADKKVMGQVNAEAKESAEIRENTKPPHTAKAEKKYYVAAPCADSKSSESDISSGFFFERCDFALENNTNNIKERNAQVYLSRPWRPFGRCFFFNCRIGEGFSPELWHIWNSDNDKKTAGFYISCGNSAQKSVDSCQRFNIPKLLEVALRICVGSKCFKNKEDEHSLRKDWGEELSETEKKSLLLKIKKMLNFAG